MMHSSLHRSFDGRAYHSSATFLLRFPRSFARLSARGLGAVALAPGATRVRSKEGPTVLALALGAWTSHEPASPQAHDLQIAAETEENGGEKSGPKKIEADQRRGDIF